MSINNILVVSCILSFTTTVSAASIKLAGTTGEVPFNITRLKSDESPFSIVLQMENAGPEITVLIWQLELELRSEALAAGNLRFKNVFAPPMSLFGDSPGPISDLTIPDVHVNIFDGDLIGSGRPIPGNESRNIVGLELESEDSTTGTFQLVMPVFDPTTPTVGSSLLLFGQFEPVQFDNSSPSDFEGYILLGTITLIEAPEPTPAQLLLMGALFGNCLIRTRKRFPAAAWEFHTP